MIKKNILLTAFLRSSSEMLIKDIENYKKLILPNDKIKDSQILIEILSRCNFDYIISFGQRPNIKDKVHIETTAKSGGYSIDTNFDCNKLKLLLEKESVPAKISHNAGTSYCNELYYNGLKYIFQNKLKCKMVFVHIPFAKNIDDFYSFQKQIFDSVLKL